MKFGWMIGCASGLMMVACAAKTTVPPTTGALSADPAISAAAMPAVQVAVTTRPTTQGIIKETAFTADADGRFVQRNWSPALGSYPNGGTPAGPTYWQNSDQPSNRPEWQDPFVDLGQWAWDTITFPYHAIVTPPWRTVTYGAGAQQAPVPGSQDDPVQAPARSGK